MKITFNARFHRNIRAPIEKLSPALFECALSGCISILAKLLFTIIASGRDSTSSQVSGQVLESSWESHSIPIKAKLRTCNVPRKRWEKRMQMIIPRLRFVLSRKRATFLHPEYMVHRSRSIRFADILTQVLGSFLCQGLQIASPNARFSFSAIFSGIKPK